MVVVSSNLFDEIQNITSIECIMRRGIILLGQELSYKHLLANLGTLTKPHNLFDSSPTDQEATDDEERQMDVVSLFITNSQSALIEQPIERRFDDIPKPTQAAAVFGVPFGDPRSNATLTKRLTNLLFGIVGSIRQHFVGTPARSASRLSNGPNPIDQRDGQLRIMDVRPRVLDRQRNSAGLDDQMTLTAILAPIRGVWAGLLPPKSARTEQLSIAEVDQSISPATPNSSSRTCQIVCHRPACCQSRRRRQQVMPLPHPISCGRYSHGMPVLSTNRIPLRQARSGRRGRPPLGLGGSGGKCGLIRSHNSSDTSGLAMFMSSMTKVSGHGVHRPNRKGFNRFC